MLTFQQRSTLASAIINAMRKAYAEWGETGDFEDGLRYLTYDTSDSELQYEHENWCKAVA